MEMNVAKNRDIVTYNDGTILALIKSSQNSNHQIEKAEVWDDNDEIDDCVYSEPTYI